MSGGFVGVDVFFVISGFVISRLLFRELAAGSLRLGEFFSRRTRRLLPALTLTLVVVCAASLLLLSPFGPQQQTGNTAMGAGLFGANVQLFGVRTGYFDLDSEANALLHTWSLGVEEQFYLMFPFALAFMARLRVRRTIVLGVIAAGSAMSFGLAWLTSHGYLAALAHVLGGGITKFAFYMPMTRAWEFGIGILVGVGVTIIPSRVFATTSSLVGAGLVVVTVFSIDHATPFPGTAALAPTLGTALLLIGGLREDTPITRLLSWRPLVWIGDLSYSWYLWHWPAIVVARAWFPASEYLPAIAALLGLVPAWLSYRFVEQPIREAERWRGRRALVAVGTCIAISIAASRALVWIADRQRDAMPESLVAALAPHAGAERGCTSGPAPDELERCTVGPAAAARVFLVGDSNADHFAEPVEQAATALGMRTVIAARTACPFVDALVHMPGRSAASCRAYVRAMVDAMIAQRPAVVVIASASSVYLNDPHTVVDTARDADEMRARWTSGLRTIVEKLTAANIRVVIVHTVPNLRGFALATCPYLKLARDPAACAVRVSRTEIEQQQRPARDAERAAVIGLASATTLDVTAELCSATECSAERDGLWLYRDEGHLSVAGAKSLTTVMQRAMEVR